MLINKCIRELREAAIAEKHSAKNFKDYAKSLRDNPDPTIQQLKEKNEKATREYQLQAAQKWPEFVKEGSEFQKQVGKALATLKQHGLDVAESPALWYFAAEHAATASDAARVPGLEKELGETKAKVKELELLVTPGGGVEAAPRKGSSEMSDDEEGAELQQFKRSRNRNREPHRLLPELRPIELRSE